MKWLKNNWHWPALGVVLGLHVWQLMKASYESGRVKGIADMMIEADRERREMHLARMTTVVHHVAPPAAAEPTPPENAS